MASAPVAWRTSFTSGSAEHSHALRQPARAADLIHMAISHHSILGSGFRVVSASSVQRQWWFQDVSGRFRVGG
jgi:hypothetical protein